MNWLTSAGSWLFGGGGATKIVDVADKAFHTEQERAEGDAKDLESARAMALPSHSSKFDILIDGLNRLIRPTFTVWLFGGFTGWWALPKPSSIDPYWYSVFTIVITFWFGGRMILKDLPAALRLMRKG